MVEELKPVEGVVVLILGLLRVLFGMVKNHAVIAV